MNTTLTNSPTEEEIQEFDSPDLENLDDLEVKSTSYNDIYNEIYLNGEIILVIDKVDLPKLKNGLGVAKANHVKKVREQGLLEPTKKLEYIPHTEKQEGIGEDQMKISIVLKDVKQGIVVHKIIKPEGI